MVNELSVALQFQLSIYIIGAVFGGIILILMIRMYMRHVPDMQTNKSLQYLSILHIIFWIIHHLIFVFAYVWYAYNGAIATDTILWYIYVSGINIMTTLAEFSLFMIILGRLYYTFKGSMHELPRYAITFFIILIFMGCLLLLLGLWIYNGILENISTAKRLQEYGPQIYTSGSLILVSVGLCLIFIFTKKIVTLTVSQLIKVKQSKLFKIAVKTSMLSTIAVLAFNAFIIPLMLIDSEIIIDVSATNNEWEWIYIVRVNEVITVSIEMVCMLLLSNTTNSLYDKCCVPCHYLCRSLMILIMWIRFRCSKNRNTQLEQFLLNEQNITNGDSTSDKSTNDLNWLNKKTLSHVYIYGQDSKLDKLTITEFMDDNNEPQSKQHSWIPLQLSQNSDIIINERDNNHKINRNSSPEMKTEDLL